VDYLFNVRTGRVERKVMLPESGGTTAGIGRRAGRHFVAVYVAPDRASVVLQINALRLELDGKPRAIHKRRLGGTISELVVSRPGEPEARVRQSAVGPAIRRVVDPFYDGIDEMVDDFLADVAEIVNSEERRHWFLKLSDPEAGPWGALDAVAG
jgi:hypothetical protein